MGWGGIFRKGYRPMLSPDTLFLFKLPLLIHFEHCSTCLVLFSHQTCLQSFFCQGEFLHFHSTVFVQSYTLWIFSYKPLNVLKQTFLILYFLWQKTYLFWCIASFQLIFNGSTQSKTYCMDITDSSFLYSFPLPVPPHWMLGSTTWLSLSRVMYREYYA